MPFSRRLIVLAPLALAAALQAQPPAPVIPAGVQAEKNLVYARTPQKDLLIDLYRPENPVGRLPVVLWVHGGAWRAGSKERTPALRQAARGYAVASISYRLSSDAIFPAQIHDCKAAVRWLRANATRYNLDPDRIAAWGSSAGGHLVALLGTSGGVPDLEGPVGVAGHSSRVRAVIDFFGPTDFLQMNKAGSRMDHDAPDSPESHLIGAPIQQNPDKAARANPIAYVSGDDPPFLIMHGDQDFTVPHHQSELLHAALKKAGIEASFQTVKGAGHGFGGPEIDRAVDAFLDKHLKSVRMISAAPPPASWADPDRTAPAGTKYATFPSKVVGTDVSYLVYLPPGYETGGTRYPVIYWLHGLGGNQRSGAASFVSAMSGAMRAGQAPPAIIVLVNGMRDSMYTDQKNGPTPMEAVIVRDLIPHIDSTYRTIPQRAARAIEGYSMGGFGAARLGFKYPAIFGVVSIMAGALHNEDSLAEGRRAIFDKTYGGDKAYFREHSPWKIVEENAAQIAGRTAVRIGVGDQDRLLEWNRQYHERMLRLKIENEYFLVPGVGHNQGQFYRLLGDRVWTFYKTAFANLKPAASGANR